MGNTNGTTNMFFNPNNMNRTDQLIQLQNSMLSMQNGEGKRQDPNISEGVDHYKKLYTFI